MFIFLFSLLFFSNIIYSSNNIDSLIINLESKMEKRSVFDSNKEKLMNSYKNILNDSTLDAKTKFQITKKLIYALEYYSFDAALYYTLENLKIAKLINDILLIVEVCITHIHVINILSCDKAYLHNNFHGPNYVFCS